jgi:hypothetical protein
MDYTKESNKLQTMYRAIVNDNSILQLPTFNYRGCNITVTYKPDDNGFGVLAVKIRTPQNVIFTPFYLKNEEDKDVVTFIPFFDNAEFSAIKQSIIIPDKCSTVPLFLAISQHILGLTINEANSVNVGTWEEYRRERTAHPNVDNDNILPMTIKNVRIGDSSKKRIRRCFLQMKLPSNKRFV